MEPQRSRQENERHPIAKFFSFGTNADEHTVILTALFLNGWSLAFGCFFLSWGYWWYALSAIFGIAFFNCLNTGSKRPVILYALVLSAGW